MLAVESVENFIRKKTGFHLATLQGFVSIQRQSSHHQVLMDMHLLLGGSGIQKNCLEKMQ